MQKPFLFYEDGAFLENGSDLVDNNLHSGQQATVIPLNGDVKVNPVVGEACEGERAGGPHVEQCAVVRPDDPTAEGLTGICPHRPQEIRTMQGNKLA